MDFDIIKTQLLEWITSFVEEPNPNLGNWAPCPYARAARINNRIHITNSSIDELAQVVNQNITLLDQFEVVVICFDHTEMSGDDCAKLTAELNAELMKQDVVILEDHPDLLEHVHGVKMNFGQCGLYVVQRLTKLNEAAQKLHANGYYEHWTTAELNEVVTWRYQ
jgi:hypothetical protein